MGLQDRFLFLVIFIGFFGLSVESYRQSDSRKRSLVCDDSLSCLDNEEVNTLLYSYCESTTSTEKELIICYRFN